MGPNKAVPAELASAVSDTASQSRQPAEPSGYPTEILLQHSLMKWLLPFAVTYIVYALAFALMFRCSTLCYMSDDPDVPQPYLAYGYHADPETNRALRSLFHPFTLGLSTNNIVFDPGDFSGTSGWRRGWSMPLLIWPSTSGKVALLFLVVSIVAVASDLLPRMLRWFYTARGYWRPPLHNGG